MNLYNKYVQQKSDLTSIPYNKKFVLMSIFLCTINLIMLSIKMFFSSNKEDSEFPFLLQWVPFLDFCIHMNMCLKMWLISEVLFITNQMSTFSCLYPLWVWMYTRTFNNLCPQPSQYAQMGTCHCITPPQHFRLLYMDGCRMVQFHYIAPCNAIKGYSSPFHTLKQYSIPLGGIIRWMNPLGRMMWREMC